MSLPQKPFRILVLFLLATAITGHLRAATNVVTTTADSGAGSLREVIANSLSGDIITLDINGTITLTSGQLSLSESLKIVGPGPAIC